MLVCAHTQKIEIYCKVIHRNWPIKDQKIQELFSWGTSFKLLWVFWVFFFLFGKCLQKRFFSLAVWSKSILPPVSIADFFSFKCLLASMWYIHCILKMWKYLYWTLATFNMVLSFCFTWNYQLQRKGSCTDIDTRLTVWCHIALGKQTKTNKTRERKKNDSIKLMLFMIGKFEKKCFIIPFKVSCFN